MNRIEAIKGLIARVHPLVAHGARPALAVRDVYAAITAELVELPSYDPETDVRVRYLRAVLQALRDGPGRVAVDPELEFAAGYAAGLVPLVAGHWSERETAN